MFRLVPIVLLPAALILGVRHANAADNSSVGFNETWVSGYYGYLGNTCTDCPTNNFSASLSTISQIMSGVVQQHVETFRDILPISLIENSGSASNYTNILPIAELYSSLGIKLVLSFGLPIPASMSVTGSTELIMPTSDSSWSQLKDSLAYAIGSFLVAMWNDPSISRGWMSTHVFVEGFNEFDSLLTLQGLTSYSTPQRAADLENGIAFVMNEYGVSVQYAMPSVSGSYSGYPAGVDPRAQYVADYYTANGTGLPNVHIYVPVESPNTTTSDIIDALSSEVAVVSASIPSSYQGQMILGETGNADATPPDCPAADGSSYTTAIPSDERVDEYSGIASNPTILSDVGLLTFWRLMKLQPSQVYPNGITPPACEPFYGVVDDDGTYEEVGTNLFTYLQQ